MKTLEEIKDGYAKECGYDNWAGLFDVEKEYPKDMEENYYQVAERFANAKAKALLEEAAEKFNSLKIENKSQIFIDGYNEAAFDMMQIIKSLSLIPKQE